MAPPFVDSKLPEVCARVVYRLYIMKYGQPGGDQLSGTQIGQLLLDECEPLRGTLLYSCLLAAQFAIIRRTRLREWRDTAIAHSRAGCGFRRCWYDDYKATRRDPRVTNRGVMVQRSLPDVNRARH